MKELPPEIKANTVYFFIRVRNEIVETARFYYFKDGSANISGAIEFGFEERPDAWESALRKLEAEGFEFESVGRCADDEDFSPKPGEDPLEAMRRWAQFFNQ